MLLEDPSRTFIGSPALVVELFESANQPWVQPAGRTAQPAQAVVLALAETSAAGPSARERTARPSLRVLVMLHLTSSNENVTYASTALVTDAELPGALEEAQLFTESMGFILDSTGWPRMDVAGREQLTARLPAFRAPAPQEQVKAVERKSPVDPLAQVARLFAAFAALLAALALQACGGMTAEQRSKSAEINYDLGTNALQHGDAQGALASYLQGEKDDPDMPQLHNALGLLYGFSLDRPIDAEAEFKQAISLKDDFSEADNNYGAFLLSRNRFADAIAHFERAIANPLYSDRTVAECNLAWAYYKTGATDRAVAQLRSALQVSPKFCKGWRQLGTIFSEKNELDDASDAFGRYAECADVADAQLQLAQLLSRQAKGVEARKALERCVSLGRVADPNTASVCSKRLRGMEAP